MSEETKKEKNDNSVKFTLEGGPLTGVVVRLYPDDRKKPGVLPNLYICDGMYAHPPREHQDAKKPKLYWR